MGRGSFTKHNQAIYFAVAAVLVTIAIVNILEGPLFGVGRAFGTPGSVVSYSFDAGTWQTTYVEDESGNNLDAVYGAGSQAPTPVVGWDDSGAHFDGNQYLLVPYDPVFDQQAFTIEGWLRLDQAPFGEADFLLRKSATLIDYSLALQDDAGMTYLIGGVTHQDPSTQTVRSHSPLILPGEWVHFAFTYDGDWLRLYLNGNLEEEKQIGGPLRHNTAPMYIGSMSDSLAFFNGTLDELQFHDYAKTSFDLPPPPPPPDQFAEYLFDNNLQDNRGSHDASPPTSFAYVSGVSNQAIDIANGELTIPHHEDFNTESFTIEAHVKIPYSLMGVNNIARKGIISPLDMQYYFRFSNDALQGGICPSSSQCDSGFVVEHTQTWIPGRWYQVAFSFEDAGANQVMKLYVDGVEVQSYTRPDEGFDFTTQAIISDFSGALDNLRFYNQPVSEFTLPNFPPKAEANGPYTAEINEQIQLSSAGSQDYDGSIASYHWDVQGIACSFVDADVADPSITCTESGTAMLTVQVTDNEGSSSEDTASLTVNLITTCDGVVLEPGEECDGTLLGGETCVSQGYDGGTLACQADCTFDYSGCYACNDGVVNGPTEECDMDNLGGYTCDTLPGYSFDGGTLTCFTDCTFDTSGCTSNLCDNGNIDPGEDCDGTDLNGETCVSQGFDGGTLVCTPGTCVFDTTNCYVCGDGAINPGEECDDGNTQDGDGCSSSCLREPLQVFLESPADGAFTTNRQADFTCSATGAEVFLLSFALTNETYLALNATNYTPPVSDGVSETFTIHDVPFGTYDWGCFVQNSTGQGVWSENRTFSFLESDLVLTVKVEPDTLYINTLANITVNLTNLTTNETVIGAECNLSIDGSIRELNVSSGLYRTNTSFATAKTYPYNVTCLLSHGANASASGVVAVSPRCGDGTCNGGETCNSCATDCGACTSSPLLLKGSPVFLKGSPLLLKGSPLLLKGDPRVIKLDSSFADGDIERIVIWYNASSYLHIDVDPLTGISYPSGITYGVFNITPSFTDGILNTTIYFRVRNAWLESNSVDPVLVMIAHNDNGTWKRLNTKVRLVNISYTHFVAQTEGFSPFVIYGFAQEEPFNQPLHNETPLPVNGTRNDTVNETPTNQTNMTGGGDEDDAGTSGLIWYVLGAIVMVVVVVGALLYVRNPARLQNMGKEKPHDLQQLQEYVDSCRDHGVPDDQVRQKLLFAGWTTSDIEEVLKHAKKKTPPKTVHRVQSLTPQQVENLRAFIHRSKAQGYDKNQIREMLISAGWKEELVKEILH